MLTRTELLERFPLLTNLSARQIGRFERDLTTPHPRFSSDNREHRQQAAGSIVDPLRMSPGDATYMVSNLMIHKDGTSERSTTHRDSHTPSRKRRRIAPPTPEPEEEDQVEDDDEGTTLVDITDGAIPRQSLLTPGDTPSRAPPVQLHVNAGLQEEETPTRGPAVDDLMLENGMLRARLTEAEHEASELQVALAREQGEHMSEREKRMRLKRGMRAMADEEDQG
ncbi:hypothetical protein Slin15195_G043790 [Septoria linicola]|uniref:Uncharacterized protein n=1 Tax=Septoria linicola TaxID=215465 RepID=A0A9Q9EHJ9_9PEZI|nr:hypothetical protein Slin14017_G047310 [Septoria linicola]USW51060.1 hypothetical protein Slin15195_G043790 [Septoria linicola]